MSNVPHQATLIEDTWRSDARPQQSDPEAQSSAATFSLPAFRSHTHIKMASKQILAFLLVAMVAAACVSGQGLNCWDRSNCQYCQYCNQRSQCNSGTMSSDAQKLCPCAFQCDNNCGHFCGSGGASGKRLLLGRGLNEVVDA